MNESERTLCLETSLERQLAWISAAEAKVSFVFAVDTAMLGFLAALAPKSANGWTVLPAVLTALALAALAACLGCLACASFPRVGGPKGSLLFFGGIVERNSGQFSDECQAMTGESYFVDLCDQVHRNAEIANLKFRWIKRALIALYLAVPPWVATIYIFYSVRGS